jgi:methylenetetrahydrofolate reductase (NADPH)
MKYSFEVFPPTGAVQKQKMLTVLSEIENVSSEFVSVTYGAQGGKKEKSIECVQEVSKRGHKVFAHITCGSFDTQGYVNAIEDLKEAGAYGFVVLRGDGQATGSVDIFEAIECASSYGPVYASAYPTPHPDFVSHDADVEWMRRKVAAGATGLITQFEFDPFAVVRYRDTLYRAGIDVPLVPGLIPFHSWAKIQNFALKCGVTPSQSLKNSFDQCTTQKCVNALADKIAKDMRNVWVREGFCDAHIYTLNQSINWMTNNS